MAFATPFIDYFRFAKHNRLINPNPYDMPQLVTQSANRRAGREIYAYGWQIKQGINLIGKTIEKYVKKKTNINMIRRLMAICA